jgi:hypothetical protein
MYKSILNILFYYYYIMNKCIPIIRVMLLVKTPFGGKLLTWFNKYIYL